MWIRAFQRYCAWCVEIVARVCEIGRTEMNRIF